MMGACGSLYDDAMPSRAPVTWYQIHAARVIDGDTIEAVGGVTIRLLGIDAPERDTMDGQVAKQRLMEIISPGEMLQAGLEGDRTDLYGRALAWIVDPGGGDDGDVPALIQTQLAAEGLVVPYRPDYGTADQFTDAVFLAAQAARADGRGVWRPEGPGPAIFAKREQVWPQPLLPLEFTRAPVVSGDAVVRRTPEASPVDPTIPTAGVLRTSSRHRRGGRTAR